MDSTAPTLTPLQTRAHALQALYGEASADLVERVERRLEAITPRPSTPRWDERTAWAITYPDQVSSPGEAPLTTLRSLVAGHLQPEITGIHVLPWHPSSSDGGFSVTSFDEIDPAFGSWTEVEALAETTAVMGDAVINHASAQGDWFRRYLAGDAEYARFFRTVDPEADLGAVVRPRAAPLVTTFERADGSSVTVWATFSPDQIDLDYRNPDVLLRMLDVVLAYVEAGATAIRLDAVAFVWKLEGTSSIHLPETHLIIQFLRACIDAVGAGVMLITETNVPHHENVAYFGPPGVREAQAVYQFPLPPLVLHSFISGSVAALRDWAADLTFDRDDVTFLNFLASHDGIGLRPAEGLLAPDALAQLEGVCTEAGGIVNHRQLADGTEKAYELTGTWYAHLAVGHDDDSALDRHIASHAIALSLRGVPLLYVHSLFASGNDAPALSRSGRGRDLNRARFAMADLTEALSDPTSRPAQAWQRMSAMLRFRSSTPAFAPSAAQEILAGPDGLFLVHRRAPTGEQAFVAVNVSSAAIPAPVPPGPWITLAGDRSAGGEAVVPAWSSLWLRST